MFRILNPLLNIAGRRSGAIVAMFHGVGDSSFSADDLRMEVRMLRAAGLRIVPLSELVARMRDGDAVEGLAALTFDDGLRNHAQIAYPVLQELAAPATFFVCPQLIDEQRWIWTLETRARLRSMGSAAREALLRDLDINVPTSTGMIDSVKQALARVRGIQIADARRVSQIMDVVKKLPKAQHESAADAVRKATPEFRATPAQRLAFDSMSWQELCALDSRLITIGSHSMSHALLHGLSSAQYEYEIRTSRAALEARLQREVALFCYPNGDFDERSLAETRSTYQAAVSTARGRLQPSTHLHLIPRVTSYERGPGYFAWALAIW